MKPKEYSFSIEGNSVPIKANFQIKEILTNIINDLLPDQLFLMSDENVAQDYDVKRWLKDVQAPINQIILKPGEKEKSLECLSSILFSTEELGLNSQSVLIIVGGGNVGNLGGLVAGLLCRGIPFIHIPTSLVAQLDSAIGAKQSVNGHRGKNYFGLYHPPKAVLVNPLFLTTLPTSEIQSGLVEALKHGFCQSAELVDLVKRFVNCDWKMNLSMLWDILNMTISLKIEYMNIDPYESDPKQFLELGHKVGHALEQLSKGELSHGFCVAFGMVAECLFFARKGDCNKSTTEYVVEGVRTIYGSLELPMDIPEEAIAHQLLFDNKRRGDLIPFSYLQFPQKPLPASIRLTDTVLSELTYCIGQAKEQFK